MFEHIEFFWLMFNGAARAGAGRIAVSERPGQWRFSPLPGGLLAVYPDAGAALARWGQRSGFACVLLESFTAYRDQDIWNDQVAVFLKDRRAGPPSLGACWSVSGAI